MISSDQPQVLRFTQMLAAVKCEAIAILHETVGFPLSLAPDEIEQSCPPCLLNG